MYLCTRLHNILATHGMKRASESLALQGFENLFRNVFVVVVEHLLRTQSLAVFEVLRARGCEDLHSGCSGKLDAAGPNTRTPAPNQDGPVDLLWRLAGEREPEKAFLVQSSRGCSDPQG